MRVRIIENPYSTPMTIDVHHCDEPGKKRPKHRRALFSWLVTFVGLICCGQFVITGLYGVARGYSVQGYWSQLMMSFGYLCVAVGLIGPPRKAIIPFLFAVFVCIYSCSVSIAQGKHETLGKRHYEQDRHREALKELQKETGTWYLRLAYNYHEPSALDLAARAYCQLEDYDTARATYETIAERYDGFYQQRAQARLAEMAKALDDVRRYREAAANQADPFEKAMILYDLARTYHYPLSCHKKALQIYQQITQLDVPDRSKELARKCIEQIRTGRLTPTTQPSSEPNPRAQSEASIPILSIFTATFSVRLPSLYTTSLCAEAH